MRRTFSSRLPPTGTSPHPGAQEIEGMLDPAAYTGRCAEVVDGYADYADALAGERLGVKSFPFRSAPAIRDWLNRRPRSQTPMRHACKAQCSATIEQFVLGWHLRAVPAMSVTKEALADLAINQGSRWWRGQDLNLRPSGYEAEIGASQHPRSRHIMPAQQGFSPPRCSPPLPAVYRCAGTWLVHGGSPATATQRDVVQSR